MSRIRELPLDALNGLDLLPLARFASPLSRIAEVNGIRFQREIDDLDYYEISALALDGESVRQLVFALRAYCRAPPSTVDILLPAEWLGAPGLRRTIADIARALRLPADCIGWAEDSTQPTKPNRDERRSVS